MSYPESMAVGEARERYFEASGIEPGYDASWVKLEAGPLPIWFPNTRGRVRAARLHDLHHVATGYPTTWKGEAEIGAWEIASGCGSFVWAWLLNLSAFAVGLALWPGALRRAFLRGRHSRSLYQLEDDFRETLLHETVGSLRQRLGLGREVPRRASDELAFAGWAVLAVAYAAWIPALALYALFG